MMQNEIGACSLVVRPLPGVPVGCLFGTSVG